MYDFGTVLGQLRLSGCVIHKPPEMHSSGCMLLTGFVLLDKDHVRNQQPSAQNARSPYLAPHIGKVNGKYFRCPLASYFSSNSNLSCFSVSICKWVHQRLCPECSQDGWPARMTLPKCHRRDRCAFSLPLQKETEQTCIQTSSPKFKRKILNSKILLEV